MNDLSTITRVHLAPPVRFEPCLVFALDHGDAGVCAGCGWPNDDHEPAQAA